MKSAEDGPVYKRRRNKMQQGLGNVSSLEKICEEDQERALQQVEETGEALQAVEGDSFYLRLRTPPSLRARLKEAQIERENPLFYKTTRDVDLGR